LRLPLVALPLDFYSALRNGFGNGRIDATAPSNHSEYVSMC